MSFLTKIALGIGTVTLGIGTVILIVGSTLVTIAALFLPKDRKGGDLPSKNKNGL